MVAPRVFRASLAPFSPAPAPGQRAWFTLDDRRRVDIHVPHAVACGSEACEAVGFRIEVFRPDGALAAALTAGDLVGVFGAQAAARAVDAFVAGDLAGARRLIDRAGGAWRGLGELLREVSAARRRS